MIKDGGQAAKGLITRGNHRRMTLTRSPGLDHCAAMNGSLSIFGICREIIS